MKYVWIAALCFGILSCQGNTQDKTEIKTQKDSVSYSIGLSIGKNLKAQLVEINPAIVARGIKDAIDSSKPAISEEQAQAIMMDLQKRMMAKQQEAMKTTGEKNKKDGEAFMAENKKKEGVITLPSGLQYKVITMGTGKKPKASETVEVNYRGTLIDGTEFDNSFKRGQPTSFTVNQVNPGWTEGLQLMPVGSKWQLFIPSNLAYGERGAGQTIPPNSTLILEVELLSVK